MTDIIKYTSLFSCAGIGETFNADIGLEAAVSNELLGNRARYYQAKYKTSTMIPGDIMDDDILDNLIKSHINKGCTLTLMSPPCQDFSTAGARDHTNPRAFLYERGLQFLEGINEINEHVFIEEVPAFFTAKLNKEIPILTILKEKLYELGYKYISHAILDPADFGVPQHRRRAFLVASKKGLWRLPKKDIGKQLTIRDTISHLPSLEAGEYSDIPYHYSPYWSKRYVEVMKHTPSGCSAYLNPYPWKPTKVDKTEASYYRSAWCRADWDKPSGAILMKSAGMGGMISCHPGRLLEDGTYSDARAFTPKELMLLTGLPDNYKVPTFALNDDELIRDVIGECVCPLMERKIMELIPR